MGAGQLDPTYIAMAKGFIYLTAVLDVHVPHQGPDMPAPYMQAQQAKLISQHLGAHEGVFQVQLINMPHQRQIGWADRLGQVIHRAPADLEQLGLPGYGPLVGFVNHGFALSSPALVSARSKKSFSSAN